MSTKQKRKPVALETGKRYKGSAVVNDFGEIQFTPYQSLPEGESTGMKILAQTKDYTLYHSEKKIKVAITVSHGTSREIHDSLATAFSHALVKLDDYEL